MNKKCAAIFLVAIICLFMPTSVLAWTPAWQKMPLEKNEYFVETDTGVTIYMVEKKLRRTLPSGERKAVLLIHGFGIGYAYYDLEYKDYSMMEHLARNGFDVFAVDQRGYGQSSPVSGLSVRAEQSVLDLKSVLDFIKDRTGVEKISIVGHSWGGAVAITMAGNYSEDIDKVVLIGTPYKLVHPAFAPTVEVLIALAKSGVEYIPNTHHLTVADSLYSYEEEVVALYQDWVDQMYSMVPTGLLLDLEFFEYGDYVPGMEMPTLLINGQNEYVVDYNDAFDCLKDLPADKKDLLILGNAPHLIFLEEFAHKRLNEAVSGWLSK